MGNWLKTSKKEEQNIISNDIKKFEENNISNNSKKFEKNNISNKKIHTLSAKIENKDVTIELIKKIGSGESSDVFEGIIKESKEKIAVKLFNFKNKESEILDLEFCENEVEILKNLSENERICKLLYSSKIENNKEYIFYLVLELGEETLYSLISKKQFTDKEIDHFFQEMIIIFSDLENIGIFYRDIKPQNIILFSNNQYKLIDFDVSDNLTLKTNKLKFDEELKIDLKGTPRYFSPELKKNYTKIKMNLTNKKEYNEEGKINIKKKIFSKNENNYNDLVNKLNFNIDFELKFSENIIKIQEEEKTNCSSNNKNSKDFDEISEENQTIQKFEFDKNQETVPKEDLKDDLSLKVCRCTLRQLNKNIKAIDCFKYDVFSLGIVLLEIGGINIQNINENSEYSYKLVESFKKKYPLSICSKYIDQLMNWNIKQRLDFKEILDKLIFEDNLNPNLLSTNQRDNQFIEFISRKSINEFWWNEDENILKNHYFASNGRISLKVPKEFINFILEPIEYNNIRIYLNKELEDNFFSLENKFSKEEKNLIKDILGREKEKNKKHQKHFHHIFLNIYTLETFFVYKLNSYLGENNLEKCKYFYSFFIKKRDIHFEDIKYLYRILILNKSDQNFTIRNQYLKDNEFYWPTFTSTSLKKEVVFNFINQKYYNKQISKKDEIILFKIEVNKNKKNNKINLIKDSFYPEEIEILLLPYFYFKVLETKIKTKRILNMNKNIYKIKVEEIEKSIIDFNIVWIDKFVKNEENTQYQNIFREVNDNLFVFDNIEEAIQFIKKEEKFAFIITAGGIAEKLFNQIESIDKVLKVIVFTRNNNKYKYLIKKYSICKAICEDISQILFYIPKKKYIY